MITLTVNGVQHSLDIDPSTPLLYALRNDLHLHGAKFGCGLGQCGACTVIVGDQAVFSCLIPVSSIGARPVRTIESLGTVEHPGALQKSFIDHQAAQCGYCIAALPTTAHAADDMEKCFDVAMARFESDQALRAQLQARDQQLAERGDRGQRHGVGDVGAGDFCRRRCRAPSCAGTAHSSGTPPPGHG